MAFGLFFSTARRAALALLLLVVVRLSIYYSPDSPDSLSLLASLSLSRSFARAAFDLPPRVSLPSKRAKQFLCACATTVSSMIFLQNGRSQLPTLVLIPSDYTTPTKLLLYPNFYSLDFFYLSIIDWFFTVVENIFIGYKFKLVQINHVLPLLRKK